MAVSSRELGGAPRVPGNRAASAVIWGVGLVMTYAALDQATAWSAAAVAGVAVALQAVLTLGQSPVWRGRGGLISYALLALDTVINFGGVMAIMANIDDVGSVQALTATFGGWQGEWPAALKGALALLAAAVVAGLPEFLWKLEG
jgi:hypothetical protein